MGEDVARAQDAQRVLDGRRIEIDMAHDGQAELPCRVKRDLKCPEAIFARRLPAGPHLDADDLVGMGLRRVDAALRVDQTHVAAFADLSRGGVPHAVPLVALLDVEHRGAEEVLAIRKRLVREYDPAFLRFAAMRAEARHRGQYPPLKLSSRGLVIPLTVALNGAR